MSELDAKPYKHIDAGRSPAAASAPQHLFCITVYNEPVEAVVATLVSLQTSLAQARRAGLRSGADACLCLVIDGREKMDERLLQFLLDARLVTPEALQRDGVTRLFFASRAPHDLPWPGARCDDTETVDTIVCIKGRNQGKLHSHALFFGHLCARLQPRLCFQIDCGTTVEPAAVSAMLAQFEREPGTAALASRVTTPAPGPADGLLASWQFMDFATQAAVFWPAELASGHLSVLPGQFCALRWAALSGGATLEPLAGEHELRADRGREDDTPLSRYLRGLSPEGSLERTMFLAEDRVIGNELIVAARPWRLGCCDDAHATTDACTALPELLRQRRRWNNGSTACRLWLVAQWGDYMRRPDRDMDAKLRFTLAQLWQVLLVLQQLVAPAVACCLYLLVARAVDFSLAAHGPALPAVLGLSLAAGLGAALWPGRRRGVLRDTAFLVALVCLAALLADILPWTTWLVCLGLPVFAATICALRFTPRGRLVLRRATEYFLVVNPLMQVTLWAYAIWRLDDTSWGTKGLTHQRRRHGLGVATVLLWGGANAALVVGAQQHPALWLQGLDPLIEASLLLFGLAVAAASWPRRDAVPANAPTTSVEPRAAGRH